MKTPHRLAGLLALTLTWAAPALGLDLNSSTVPGRVPGGSGWTLSLTNGEIAINRADKVLFYKAPDGSTGLGALLNALPSGRKAVEQGKADDLTVTTGTATNTLSSLLGRAVYIADFMALGSTDITAALPKAQTKLGASGGRILFPSSSAGYTITQKVQIGSRIVLETDGRHAAVITSNFDGDVLAFGDGSTTIENSGARNITGRSSVTRTQGAFIALRGAYKPKIEDVTCDVRSYVCVDVYGGPNSFFAHLIRVHADGNPYVGIRLGYGSQLPDIPADVFISDPLIAGATRAAIEFNSVSGFQITGGDYILNKKAWLMNPGNNQKVVGSQTSLGFLDTSVEEGLLVDPTGTGQVADITFNGLWGGTNGQTTGFPAIRIKGTPQQTRSLAFNGFRGLNNGAEAVSLEGGAYIDFNDPQIGFNSLYNRGFYSGIKVKAGVSNWSIVGGRSGAGTSFTEPNPQKWGIEIEPGASDNIRIFGTDLTGNATGALSNGATGANQTIIASGAPYALLGANVGIGTKTPFSPLTVSDVSRPVSDIPYGLASAQVTVGGGNLARGLRFGVDATADVAWMQCAQPGDHVLPCWMNPGGGPVALGRASPATSEYESFPYIPVMAGAPSGTPRGITGMAPLVVDSTNGKLCAYVGSAWKCATLQ